MREVGEGAEPLDTKSKIQIKNHLKQPAEIGLTAAHW